jgi:D-apiose dehydrogenase
MSELLHVGLIGAGWVTRHHLDGWSRIPHKARVVAIADPSQERAADRAGEYAIPAIFESAKVMLAAGGLDAVDIAAPRAVHAELVRLAANAGLPILCQKPLAPTLVEAESLVKDVGGVRLMVHENWRFRAHYRQAGEWLRNGHIGAVKGAMLSLVTSGTVADAEGRFPALERQPFMRSETRMLVSEVLIHHLDTLRYLLGPLEVRAAALSRICVEMQGEDTAIIHLVTPDGTGVAVFATFAAHGAPATQRDQLLILGEAGSLRLEDHTLSVAGAQPETLSYDPASTYAGSYAATIEHFVDCLASGAEFETSPKDNLETLRLVEDCYLRCGLEAISGGGQ